MKSCQVHIALFTKILKALQKSLDFGKS